ncbi:hypothetical protein F8388_025754 [Cannabis sativa]|uniref:Uncharacterized protein n=1 Tax=Cannabis sativa TaxID=3483 RepID=A0A7J6F9I6_CANSA|nr:hypothetical protein F8388_025754 [Cannabis sativa]
MVKDVWVQQGLLALQGKKLESMTDEDWKELLAKATTLTVDEVSTALLEIDSIKQPSGMSHTDQALVTRSESSRGRSTLRGRYDDKRDSCAIHTLRGKLSATIITKRNMLGGIVKS